MTRWDWVTTINRVTWVQANWNGKHKHKHHRVTALECSHACSEVARVRKNSGFITNRQTRWTTLTKPHCRVRWNREMYDSERRAGSRWKLFVSQIYWPYTNKWILWRCMQWNDKKKNNNPAALLNQTGLNIQAEEVPSFASYYNHALWLICPLSFCVYDNVI